MSISNEQLQKLLHLFHGDVSTVVQNEHGGEVAFSVEGVKRVTLQDGRIAVAIVTSSDPVSLRASTTSALKE